MLMDICSQAVLCQKTSRMWALALSRVYGNYIGSTIRMAKEIVASFDTNDFETCFLQHRGHVIHSPHMNCPKDSRVISH